MSKPLLDKGSPSLAPHGDILKVPGTDDHAKHRASKVSEAETPAPDKPLAYPENPDLPPASLDK